MSTLPSACGQGGQWQTGLLESCPRCPRALRIQRESIAKPAVGRGSTGRKKSELWADQSSLAGRFKGRATSDHLLGRGNATFDLASDDVVQVVAQVELKQVIADELSGG